MTQIGTPIFHLLTRPHPAPAGTGALRFGNVGCGNEPTEPKTGPDKNKPVFTLPLYESAPFKQMVTDRLRRLPLKALLKLPISALFGAVTGAFKSIFSLPLIFVSPIGGTTVILGSLTEGIRHPDRTYNRIFHNREGRKQFYITVSNKASEAGEPEELIAALQNLVLLDPLDGAQLCMLGINSLELLRCQKDKPRMLVDFDNPKMIAKAKASKLDFGALSEFAFKTLLWFKPKHISANIGLASLYDLQGKTHDGIKLLDKAMKRANEKNKLLLDDYKQYLLDPEHHNLSIICI
jgi:hypothetical protein